VTVTGGLDGPVMQAPSLPVARGLVASSTIVMARSSLALQGAAGVLRHRRRSRVPLGHPLEAVGLVLMEDDATR